MTIIKLGEKLLENPPGEPTAPLEISGQAETAYQINKVLNVTQGPLTTLVSQNPDIQISSDKVAILDGFSLFETIVPQQVELEAIQEILNVLCKQVAKYTQLFKENLAKKLQKTGRQFPEHKLNNPEVIKKLLTAVTIACIAHYGVQRRADLDQEKRAKDYVQHPMSVVLNQMIARANFLDPNALVAGLLHDVFEDLHKSKFLSSYLGKDKLERSDVQKTYKDKYYQKIEELAIDQPKAMRVALDLCCKSSDDRTTAVVDLLHRATNVLQNYETDGLTKQEAALAVIYAFKVKFADRLDNLATLKKSTSKQQKLEEITDESMLVYVFLMHFFGMLNVAEYAYDYLVLRDLDEEAKRKMTELAKFNLDRAKVAKIIEDHLNNALRIEESYPKVTVTYRLVPLRLLNVEELKEGQEEKVACRTIFFITPVTQSEDQNYRQLLTDTITELLNNGTVNAHLPDRFKEIPLVGNLLINPTGRPDMVIGQFNPNFGVDGATNMSAYGTACVICGTSKEILEHTLGQFHDAAHQDGDKLYNKLQNLFSSLQKVINPIQQMCTNGGTEQLTTNAASLNLLTKTMFLRYLLTLPDKKDTWPDLLKHNPSCAIFLNWLKVILRPVEITQLKEINNLPISHEQQSLLKRLFESFRKEFYEPRAQQVAVNNN